MKLKEKSRLMVLIAMETPTLSSTKSKQNIIPSKNHKKFILPSRVTTMRMISLSRYQTIYLRRKTSE
jgi:hypothetical protein